ncbi:unnamed protein product [Brachionus calyciflorus]|uniref:LAS1 n=1 Tax=Brachionus calyciflorus TaxID=104777 RepID=A0A813M818_9BILA|nr:unnamed protein product [Brachionus calyciflorus]
MEAKKITNWVNWQEWKSVINDAYNTDNSIDLYRRAFLRILAWESREQSVPPAIICLKEILISKIYQINLASSSIEQIYWYQSTLAMNLIRFVNFITEPYQNKPKAIPIKTLATEIGIPDWIVNLRHNATHFTLPSIELLENAREFLYKWLKEKYVDKYTEVAVEESKTEKIKAWIHDSFVEYMNDRYKTVMVKSKTKESKHKTESINEDIDLAISQFKNEMIDILIDDGFLVPTKEQLNAIGVVPEEFIDEERIEIPKGFLNIWIDFLTFCNKRNGLLRILFDKLVDTYRIEADNSIQSNYLREKFILSWIFSLIKLNSYKNEKFKFSKFDFEYDLKTVLLNVLKGKPGKYCLAFLHELGKLSFINELIDSESFGKLIQLTYMISQENQKSDDQIVTNEDLNQMDTNEEYSIYNFDIFDTSNKKNNDNQSFLSYKRETEQKVKSDWKKIDEIDWNHENLKLGLVEGQTFETLNLSMIQFLCNKDSHENETESETSFEEQSENAKRKDVLKDMFNSGNFENFKKSLVSNFWNI